MGGSGTSFVPLHFYQWNKLLRVETSRWYVVIWLESHIRLVCSQALCIIYHSRSLKPVWRAILPPILQMRKQVQGAYASNQVCYISTLALSHHWSQSQITAQNRTLNYLLRCHVLHISYTLLIYQEYISDGLMALQKWWLPRNGAFSIWEHVRGAMVLLPQCQLQWQSLRISPISHWMILILLNSSYLF